ncbi:MAG: esterase-like activity of phytase family protein [Kiritimatiellae bacterium]|nr:esterase-like activity of phytase family protein [Kiritimatiellia bacterium]
MKKFLLRLFLFFWVPVLLAIVWTVFVVVCDCRSYRAALEVPDGAAVVVCGDSQTKDSLDPALFPGFFNFSTAATTCDQDLLRLGDLLSANKGRIKYVLLDVSPLKIGYTPDRPVSELNAARVHLLLHVYHLWENRRPFGSVGELYRDVVFTRKYNEFRKSMLRGKPWRSSMAGGFDPDKTAGFLNPKFRAKAESDVKEKAARVNGREPLEMDAHLLDILAESVALVRAKGAYPIVTTMPLAPPLRKALDPAKKAAFTTAVRETAVRLEVPYLDYLDLDLPLDCWHDGNHLNRSGATVFTPRFVADFRRTVKAMGGPIPDERYKLEKVGVYKSVDGVVKSRGLSGLTYAGGGTFWTIEEKSGALIELKIEVDAETGAVANVREDHRATALGGNFEGIAFDPLLPRLWVCEEEGNTIQAFDLEKGRISDTIEVPVMRSARYNRGLEALSISSSGLDMWTCNENELSIDRLASPGSSEVVRLIHFTRTSASEPWKMADQWVYRPEQPISLDPRRQRKLRNGVTSLCLMENGDLLVLERETDKLRPARCRTRIYRVDCEGATDVMGRASLASSDYVPVRKHLLYDGLTRHAQYEGLTLGPRLADGSRVVILVSDASDSGAEYFMSMKLSPRNLKQR